MCFGKGTPMVNLCLLANFPLLFLVSHVFHPCFSSFSYVPIFCLGLFGQCWPMLVVLHADHHPTCSAASLLFSGRHRTMQPTSGEDGGPHVKSCPANGKSNERLWGGSRTGGKDSQKKTRLRRGFHKWGYPKWM